MGTGSMVKYVLHLIKSIKYSDLIFRIRWLKWTEYTVVYSESKRRVAEPFWGFVEHQDRVFTKNGSESEIGL